MLDDENDMWSDFESWNLDDIFNERCNNKYMPRESYDTFY